MEVRNKQKTQKSNKYQGNYKANKIQKAATEIITSARRRYNRTYSPPRYQPKITVYQLAKNAQTIERDLYKAALYYAEAANLGQKVDSCIKDFASIVHQMGQTEIAVRFLQQARHYYKGDLKKFDRLLVTLERQINPSGKHHCKSLLFELPASIQPTQQNVATMFTNISRVKGIRVYQDLDFSKPSERTGRWLILDFQSFSAGKKTLEKFSETEFFGLNKFWLKGEQIVCLATDGREDFEKGLVVTKELLDNKLNQNSSWLWSFYHSELDLNERNRLSLCLIEGSEFQEGLSDDESD